jgi:hypothetical protein
MDNRYTHAIIHIYHLIQFIISDTSLPGTDGNGWGYATNFGSIEEGTSEVRELTHFVRRRKYTRTQMFVGNNMLICIDNVLQ